jgi:hypothetical protein
MLAHIYSCAGRFVRRRASTKGAEVECDGSFSLFSLSSSLDQFSYSTPAVSAIPIIADRVSLPTGDAASVSLDTLLPSNLSDQYNNAEVLIRPMGERDKSPRPICYAETTEYVKLIKRMQAANMVEFTTCPKVVNGVFGVPKDGDSIRLIIDARPANAVFTEPPKVELPTPDLLVNLIVPSDEPIVVAKVDLDNFYHRLQLPKWMRPYFALPAVRADEVGLSHQYGKETLVYPCCITLPMGWSHSVYVAQMAHEHLLNQCEGFSAVDRITKSNDFRVDRPRHQVYLDDLCMYAPLSLQSHLHRMLQIYTEKAQQVGLVIKWSKVVRPSSGGVECVGIEVNGNDRTVGVSVDKLIKLCQETETTLLRGFCT